MTALTAAIHGTGRMAVALVAAAEEREDIHISALVGPEAPAFETDIPWVTELSGLAEKPKLLIDFTLPKGTHSAAGWCEEHAVPLLSGVTGLSNEVHQALAATGRQAPVLWSPNMSRGVNLLGLLAETASRALDGDTPVHIHDVHHVWKKDAPSGTALMLGACVATGRRGDESLIEYSSDREGEVIGDHRIQFELQGEQFELSHHAADRAIFARGALDASTWLVKQAPGVYSARDWLSGLLGTA